MAHAAETITTLSTKGQMVLPKAVRDLNHWKAGTKLAVKQIPGGVTITMVETKKKYTIDEVFGMLKYDGPPLSEEEMDRRIDESLAQEVREGRW